MFGEIIYIIGSFWKICRNISDQYHNYL